MLYLDNNASTPIDERVFETMQPYLREFYANPASNHKMGMVVRNKVEDARMQIATLINSSTKELIFTSGATESINIALKGIAFSNSFTKKHIVTAQTEHKAVLDTLRHLEQFGFSVTYLPVNRDGMIDLKLLYDSITPDTLITVIMFVNNETGVIQDIKEISNIIHRKGSLFFCDATQAVGKIPINVNEYAFDMMAFSSHKIYGPKGIGALYINSKRIFNNSMLPLVHGGGHERGLRSGTLNAAAIIGFGKACEIVNEEMELNRETIIRLRDALERKMLNYPKAFVNGQKDSRLYNVSNICFPNLDASYFIASNSLIAVSNGSACTSAIEEPSHVLLAMGLSPHEANSCLRFSFGRHNFGIDIDKICDRLYSLIEEKYVTRY